MPVLFCCSYPNFKGQPLQMSDIKPVREEKKVGDPWPCFNLSKGNMKSR